MGTEILLYRSARLLTGHGTSGDDPCVLDMTCKIVVLHKIFFIFWRKGGRRLFRFEGSTAVTLQETPPGALAG